MKTKFIFVLIGLMLFSFFGFGAPQGRMQQRSQQNRVQRIPQQSQMRSKQISQNRSQRVVKVSQNRPKQEMRRQQNRNSKIISQRKPVQIITPNKNRKPPVIQHNKKPVNVVVRPQQPHRPYRSYVSYRPYRVRPFVSTWVFVPRQEIIYVAPTTTTTVVSTSTASTQSEVDIFSSNLAKDISSELNNKNVSSQYKMYIEVESYTTSASEISAKVKVVFERENDGSQISVEASGTQLSVDALSQEIAIKVANAVSL